MMTGALLLCLAGCGGGSNDPVTSVSASNLRYTGSLNALNLNITGNALDNTIKVSANKSACLVATATSATSRTAQCIIIVPSSRKVDIVVTSSSDYVLYTTTLTAPAPQVTLKTTLGDVVMELDSVAAPITVKNFLSYVNQNPSFYKDTLFHRVIAGFVAQGGGFTTGMVQKTLPVTTTGITLESQNGLQNVRGSVAMARQGPATGSPETDATKNSATSQFFVNLVDNAFLNYSSPSSPGYAVFGKVISGMDVIDLMATKATTTRNGYPNVPVTDITITSATQTQ
jgi:cyclophilin family peptidyl-prolyl cis-trans isomerase